MGYTAIWQSSDENGEIRILIGHPGTFTDTPEEAKEEGRKVLSDASIEPDMKLGLMPIAVVETRQDLEEKIQSECEEVEIGSELLFYDITDMDQWSSQPWWPR